MLISHSNQTPCPHVLSELFHNIFQLTRLDLGASFYDHNYLAGCGKSLGLLMMAFPELVDVNLWSCRLKVSDIEAMAEVVRGHTLKVSTWFIQWIQIFYQTSDIQLFNHFSRIKLKNCIQPDYIKIENMQKVKYCKPGNSLVGSCGEELYNHVRIK